MYKFKLKKKTTQFCELLKLRTLAKFQKKKWCTSILRQLLNMFIVQSATKVHCSLKNPSHGPTVDTIHRAAALLIPTLP